MNKKDNKIRILGQVAEIELTKKKKTLVDTSDIPLISSVKWFASSSGGKYKKWYAMAGINQKCTRMHNALLDIPKGLVCDHINGNTLDNRRSNLRICNQSENCANGSIKPNRKYGAIYKGVYYCLPRKLWIAQIKVNRKAIYLGGYKTQIEALEIYLKSAKQYFGEFSRFDSLDLRITRLT